MALVRPTGIEYLSGPPIGSFEYKQLPECVRHGFLKSICRTANGYMNNHNLQPANERKRRRQFGHIR